MEEYGILDNGGIEFKVLIYQQNRKENLVNIDVYNLFNTYDWEEERVFREVNSDDIVFSLKNIKRDNIYVAKGEKDKYQPLKKENEYNYLEGNNILVNVTPENSKKYEYILIGEETYKFTSPEKIIHFESPIGGSDVPHPFAVTKSYIFVLPFKFMVPKVLFRKNVIPSDVFYELLYQDEKLAELIENHCKFDYEVLVERI